MLFLLFPAFAGSPFLNTADAIHALANATTMAEMTVPPVRMEGSTSHCDDGTVHAGSVTGDDWKDASYQLAGAWADCLIANSYEARKLDASEQSTLRNQLTGALLQSLASNGRFPPEAVGSAYSLSDLAPSLTVTPSDSEKVVDALKDLPGLTYADSDRGVDFHYQDRTWTFEVSPWSAWVVDFGVPSSPEEAAKLVYQANLKLEGVRLLLDADGKLLLESTRLPTENQGDLRVRFQDFVSHAQALLPTLQSFAAGTLKADAALGSLR